jgi:hypothetical protein
MDICVCAYYVYSAAEVGSYVTEIIYVDMYYIFDAKKHCFFPCRLK